MNRLELNRRHMLLAGSALAALGLHPLTRSGSAQAQTVGTGTQPKPATEATKAANETLRAYLNFDDRQDFEDASRGLLARPDTLTIRAQDGHVVWDLESYKAFISDSAPAPDTVNPSLWRNAQLNMHYGLFQVHDRIFQVRAYNLANITFVQGNTGWIVLDAGSDSESTAAAYDLVSQHVGERPVLAVVYSHSHGDHYGGVRALVDEAAVGAGEVQILAPQGFPEHAINEFVIAGNAMGRRGLYMYGPLLPRSPQGGVNAGLGQTISAGTIGLIMPTREITESGEEVTIDGVQMVFQMTPGTEAPAEMNTYLPQFRAMWMAENTTNTLHNLLTLRGAQVRDALNWAKYINETIELYGEGTDIKFQAHHWPMWGNAKIIDYWRKQRDLYKFIHDRSVNLMNQGYTGIEIANMVHLPDELGKAWFNRGYYGTVKHNSRAVYQRYMGFYDANPSTLDELPPEDKARKYLEYMGGAPAILEKARADFDRGEYRWVAEALRHVVFADAANTDAKELLADAYEQMGYQAEAGTWRSIYLMGAFELRNGVPTDLPTLNLSGPDVVKAMPPDMIFDYLGVRLNSEAAVGKAITLNMTFTDLGDTYALTVGNGVLNHSRTAAASPDATLSMTKSTLDRIVLGNLTPADVGASPDVAVEGRREAVGELFGLIEAPPFWFNIVTA